MTAPCVISLLNDYNTVIMNKLNENHIALFPSFKDMRIPWQDGYGQKFAVLMSGGVDSSVTALMLLRLGFNVIGVTMDLFSGKKHAVQEAATVCRALGISHFSMNVSREFRKLVIDPFCVSYETGETPNPCATCNERVKLGIVVDLMERAWGDDFGIATGHYARILRQDGKTYLARAAYKKKDQSYFLSGIRRELLTRLRFPLGGLSDKEETREIARRSGLPVAEKPESMEICFTNEDDYRKIIKNKGEPGAIIDLSGKTLGKHSGLAGYTIGQRKGLRNISSYPLFVVEIRTGDNTLVVAPREDAYAKNICCRDLNVLIPGEIRDNAVLYGKTRSQGEPQKCTITSISLRDKTASVEFAEPVFAPAPGQRLALYTADSKVAGGGIITRYRAKTF